MQFRPACTAVSVAGVTIFTTFPLQPTKCNFLRYVCGHGDGGRKEGGGERSGGGGAGERERERETTNVESIVVGMVASRWEGYNERLAISSINIFSPFRYGRCSRRTLVPAVIVARARIHLATPPPTHETTRFHKDLTRDVGFFFFFFFCGDAHPTTIELLLSPRDSRCRS